MLEVIKKYRPQPETDQKLIILLYRMITGHDLQGSSAPSTVNTGFDPVKTKEENILASPKNIYEE